MINWVRNLPAGCWALASGGLPGKLPYISFRAEITALKGFV